MSDEIQPRATPIIEPTKPLGAAIEDLPSKNVAVAEVPTITLPAADYDAAKSLVNVMEAELDTIEQDAEYDADVLIKRLRDAREATARKFLKENKALSCVLPADHEAIVTGLMQEFDEVLTQMRKDYVQTLERFRNRKTEHILALRDLLLFDGFKKHGD